jgi:hypothetical protein
MEPLDEILYYLMHSAKHIFRTVPKWQFDIHLCIAKLAPTQRPSCNTDAGAGPFAPPGLPNESWSKIEEMARSIGVLRLLHFATAVYESTVSTQLHDHPGSNIPSIISHLVRPDILHQVHSPMASNWFHYILSMALEDSPEGAIRKASGLIGFKAHAAGLIS